MPIDEFICKFILLLSVSILRAEGKRMLGEFGGTMVRAMRGKGKGKVGRFNWPDLCNENAIGSSCR